MLGPVPQAHVDEAGHLGREGEPHRLVDPRGLEGLALGAPPGVVYYSKRSLPVPPRPPPPQSRSISATVPGDVISDLQRAGIVGDPYNDTTWSQPEFVRAWNDGVWVYSKKFTIPAGGVGGTNDRVLLVLDGVRMGAMVFINGKFLGNTPNAFRRYVFDLGVGTDIFPAGNTGRVNELQIHLGEALQINCDGRYTHSDQIDWAPTMPTTDPLSPQQKSGEKKWGPRKTFGFGIWKSVYLVPLPNRSCAITNLIPHTFYAGGHPTSLLSPPHAGFEVRAGLRVDRVTVRVRVLTISPIARQCA